MNSSQPLGLPIGSVRAILALLLVGAVVVAFLWGVATGTIVVTGDKMVELALVALAFYFAGKSTNPE